MNKNRRAFMAYAGLSAAVSAVPAWAQQYPSRPVRLVVPFVAGGTTDLLARILAEKLTQSLGVAVIVENKGGGNSLIGTEVVARANPDGYTLLIHTNNFTVNQTLYAGKQPFDAMKDFGPITLVSSVPHVLVINPKVPVHNLAELIDQAKEKPETLTFASAGSGTVTHLCGELFMRMSGIQLTHIPYKGSGGVMADLLGGHVDMQFAGMSLAREYILDGRLRALAVTTPTRYARLPDVPTVAELGYPGYAFSSWFGVLAPAKTPAEVVARLNGDIVKAVNDPRVQERLKQMDFEIYGSSASEFSSFLQTDIDKAARILKESGAKVD
ncbi:Bug family tripartite tricarboxylate transporter substrate binding protein [Achromobacter piechaudii]|uniref:Uncharacterized protein n=1 Tax=Achromobacter piechaudii TaxID=72556 RepID=A0A6S7CVK4_9BURK|nr:tripartite tricarboxylate transporter substrate binding protein [Achromobacter piechaudii]CAB3867501.1 hypothetical protein LMG1861_02588 [Achromobacter piechaudii]